MTTPTTQNTASSPLKNQPSSSEKEDDARIQLLERTMAPINEFINSFTRTTLRDIQGIKLADTCDDAKLMLKAIRETIKSTSDPPRAPAFAMLGKIQVEKATHRLTYRPSVAIVQTEERYKLDWVNYIPIQKDDWSKIDLKWDRAAAEKEAQDKEREGWHVKYDVSVMLDFVDVQAKQAKYAMDKGREIGATHCAVVFHWTKDDDEKSSACCECAVAMQMLGYALGPIDYVQSVSSAFVAACFKISSV